MGGAGTFWTGNWARAAAATARPRSKERTILLIVVTSLTRPLPPDVSDRPESAPDEICSLIDGGGWIPPTRPRMPGKTHVTMAAKVRVGPAGQTGRGEAGEGWRGGQGGDVSIEGPTVREGAAYPAVGAAPS